MSIFGEFHVPAAEFTFRETLEANPDTVIEIERVVATDEFLTPYFWVSNVPPDVFEAAAREDPTVEGVRRLDEYEDVTLYRANWTDRTQTLILAYTRVGAAIIGAEGQDGEWVLRMRFDDRDELDGFSEYLNDEDVSFELRRLFEITHPRTGAQFGLTPKQTEALTVAWEMGYFDLPRETTMREVADELGIAPQSLSDRLRRAQRTLVENTLRVEGPTEHCFSGVV